MECKNIDDLIRDVYARLENVPLGNSFFQEEFFVLLKEETPARIYKTLLMQLSTYANASKKFSLELRKANVELKMIQRDYELSKDDLESELIQISIEEKEFQIQGIISRYKNAEKSTEFVQNFLNEFETLKNGFTREEFENQERFYFQRKFFRQISNLEGALGEAYNMLDIKERVEKFLNDPSLIESASPLEEFLELEKLDKSALFNPQNIKLIEEVRG